MMLLAGALGTVSGVVALELSYWVGAAASSTIVLCSAAQFLIAFVARELSGRRVGVLLRGELA